MYDTEYNRRLAQKIRQYNQMYIQQKHDTDNQPMIGGAYQNDYYVGGRKSILKKLGIKKGLKKLGIAKDVEKGLRKAEKVGKDVGKALKKADPLLDVLEYVPGVGQAVALGREAGDIAKTAVDVGKALGSKGSIGKKLKRAVKKLPVGEMALDVAEMVPVAGKVVKAGREAKEMSERVKKAKKLARKVLGRGVSGGRKKKPDVLKQLGIKKAVKKAERDIAGEMKRGRKYAKKAQEEILGEYKKGKKLASKVGNIGFMTLDEFKKRGSGLKPKSGMKGSSVSGFGKPKRKQSDKMKKRGMLVKQLMREEGMTLGEASKAIKERNLL